MYLSQFLKVFVPISRYIYLLKASWKCGTQPEISLASFHHTQTLHLHQTPFLTPNPSTRQSDPSQEHGNGALKLSTILLQTEEARRSRRRKCETGAGQNCTHLPSQTCNLSWFVEKCLYWWLCLSVTIFAHILFYAWWEPSWFETQSSNKKLSKNFSFCSA